MSVERKRRSRRRVGLPEGQVETLMGIPANILETIELWFWAACIFMMTDPFPYNFSGVDPEEQVRFDWSAMRASGEQGNNYYAYIRILITLFAFAAAVVPNWYKAVRGIPRIAPIAAFVAFCYISALWSDASAVTAKAVLLLAMPIALGWAIATRLKSVQLAKSFLYSGVIVGVTSVLYVLAFRKYGVHQLSDASQSVHAGAWRGVYIHKNAFGQLMGIFLITYLMTGPKLLNGRIFQGAAMALCALLIVLSTSASAMATPLLAMVILFIVLQLRGGVRIAAVLFAIAGAFTVFILAEQVAKMFGRDLTFTGRTEIWGYALQSIARQPILGYGFSSPYYGTFVETIVRRIGLIHAHNGFLDIWLGVGAVGLSILLAAIAYAFYRLTRLWTASGANQPAIKIMATLLLGWLLAAFSESDFRVTVPIGGFGFVVLAATLCMQPGEEIVRRQRVVRRRRSTVKQTVAIEPEPPPLDKPRENVVQDLG